MNARGTWTLETLAAGVRGGDRRALARAITLVENRDPLSYELVRELYPETGSAFVVGVTGPPGVGKSSLISALVRHVRGAERAVGVISVDPSSPFTHGALLGDRIRLSDHFLDPGVFIRSMGTRGHLGGLAEAALQALLLLDASGKDVVFVETVGTGQSDVGVLSIVDTVVLALMPGSGDSVQALKAGHEHEQDGVGDPDHLDLALTRADRLEEDQVLPGGAWPKCRTDHSRSSASSTLEWLRHCDEKGRHETSGPPDTYLRSTQKRSQAVRRDVLCDCDTEHEVLGAVAVARDVTERVERERAVST